MPKGGFYFDAIGDADLESFRTQAESLRANTAYAVIANFGQGGLGGIASIPGVNFAAPKGFRDPNVWYGYLATQPKYIAGIFDLQTAVTLKACHTRYQPAGAAQQGDQAPHRGGRHLPQPGGPHPPRRDGPGNLELLRQAVGDMIDVVILSDSSAPAAGGVERHRRLRSG